MTKEKNRPIGENSTNLVTLIAMRQPSSSPDFPSVVVLDCFI
jgi:hypothetical protein